MQSLKFARVEMLEYVLLVLFIVTLSIKILIIDSNLE